MDNKNLLLFDVDGTLMLGLGAYESSLEKAIKKEFNKKIKINLVNLSGSTDRAILTNYLEKNNIFCTGQEIDRCLYNFGEIYPANNKNTHLLPKVKSTLKKLTKGNKSYVGIVTGNQFRMARKKLDLFNLNHFLPFGAFGDESCDRSKLVKLAISMAEARGWKEKKGKNKRGKRNVYVIGDTPKDVYAALGAGVIPICVTTGRYSEKELKDAGAYKIYRDLTGVLEL